MSCVPSVCIMIPTYNQANFITKAVESALAQDYPNIEIVISDDNSTDNTEEVLQRFNNHPKISYKKNPTNFGRVGNYKKCLTDYAKADWVINLDGDDYYTNNKFISQAMNAIEKNGIANTLFYQGGNVRKNHDTEKKHQVKIEQEEESMNSADYFFTYFDRNFFCHMSTLYNRRLALETNFYQRNIISTDVYSFLHLCLKYFGKKVIISKNISGVWVQHENNISKTIDFKKHWQNFGLYVKLYHLAIKYGYTQKQCFKWISKAGYSYLAWYTKKVMAILKTKIINDNDHAII